MLIGIPKEMMPHEKRVSLTPDSVSKLIKLGVEILVESHAGDNAYFFDDDYKNSGATITPNAEDLYKSADVILKIQKPTVNEVSMMKKDSIIAALIQPLSNLNLVKTLAETSITSLSLDAIPRIARAQRMDVLSSQSSISGYKSVIIAAHSLGIHFPLMMTAAGTMPPAKGLVIGAGVAGLQAIATGKRLGAVMYAFDVRPAVKEQVESLGAKFIEAEQYELKDIEVKGGYARNQTDSELTETQNIISAVIKDMDFVITTAQIPGSTAPVLISESMVKSMNPGSIIIDLAAESGGNCALTELGKTVISNNVHIYGPENLPSTMSKHASQMFSKNMTSFIELLIKDAEIDLDINDSIIKECLITFNGAIHHQRTLEAINSR